MSAVCIIPARGGSRRIPRKNIKLFHGKPIIAYSIEAAKESGLFDHIIVSTDDEEIASVADSCGADVIDRPPDLALDEVGTQEVMREELLWVMPRPEYACCIYPCAPMMTVAQLQFGFELICDPPMIALPETYSYIPGWFYWGKTKLFLNDVPLPESGSLKIPDNYIDINTPEDWVRAELMYEALHREKS